MSIYLGGLRGTNIREERVVFQLRSKMLALKGYGAHLTNGLSNDLALGLDWLEQAS